MFFGDDSLHGLEGLVLRYLHGHIVVVVIGILVDLIINNNLVLFIAQVEEDAVLVPALGLAGEVLAVLDGAEENLHPVVDLVEGLRGGWVTMKAVAAAWALR